MLKIDQREIFRYVGKIFSFLLKIYIIKSHNSNFNETMDDKNMDETIDQTLFIFYAIIIPIIAIFGCIGNIFSIYIIMG